MISSSQGREGIPGGEAFVNSRTSAFGKGLSGKGYSGSNSGGKGQAEEGAKPSTGHRASVLDGAFPVCGSELAESFVPINGFT